jgi:protein gp37
MSDLFHESIDVKVLDGIFAVMAICHMHERIPSHTFQILTKRAERMRDYMRAMPIEAARIVLSKAGGALMEDGDAWADNIAHHMPWPLPNVLLGVSVENQKYADERMPMLCETSGTRFVSYEPALGPVDFTPWLESISWLIVGGESGPGARLFCQDWAEETIAQCKAAHVPCFFKQYGAAPVDGEGVAIALKDSKGGNAREWPKALRVREWPEVRT